MAQTTTEILNAAAALAARGERVSVRNVRAELGGGDPGTIGRALKQRREDTAAAKADAAQNPTLPDAVSRSLTEWAGRLAAELTATTRDELATTSEDYEVILAESDDLKARIEALTEELATARQEHSATAGELRAVREQAEQLAADLAAERTKAADLEQRLAAQQARILNAEKIERENAELRTENKTLIERAATASAALEAETARANQAEQRTAQAEERARAADERAAKATADAAASSAKADAAEQRAEAVEKWADRALDEIRERMDAFGDRMDAALEEREQQTESAPKPATGRKTRKTA